MSYSDDRTSANTAALQKVADTVISEGVNQRLHDCATRDITSSNGFINLLTNGVEYIAEGILFWLGLYNPAEEEKGKEYQYTDRNKPRY
ncbi:MAG: hypothetical protein WDA21_00385 [Bacilli bacterium]